MRLAESFWTVFGIVEKFFDYLIFTLDPPSELST